MEDADIAKARLLFIGTFVTTYESFEDEAGALVRQLFEDETFRGVETFGITYGDAR